MVETLSWAGTPTRCGRGNNGIGGAEYPQRAVDRRPDRERALGFPVFNLETRRASE